MDLIIPTLILVFVTILVFWVKLRKERFSILKRNGIPGPEPNFWIGNVKEIIEKREGFVSENVEKYGNIFGCFVGAKPSVVVTDQELIKIIQVKEVSKFTNRDLILEDGGIPQPEFMRSMPAVHDEEWKKMRSLVSPSFSTSKLKKLMPIFNEASAIFLENIEKERSKGYIDIANILKNLTMDIITKSALGIDTGVQRTPNSRTLQSLKLFLTTDTADILPVVSLCFPEFGPLPMKLRQIIDSLKCILGLPSTKSIMENIKEVMDYRRQRSERREDILQGLMEEKIEAKKSLSLKNGDPIASNANGSNAATDTQNKKDYETLSDESIRGTAAVLLAAGFDTTSITVSHLTHYLATYPEIQDKLREEIKAQIAGKKDIEYEDLFHLPYLDQVISETLRLHATGMLAISRIAKENFEYNSMTIPKGATVIIPSHYLQMNENNWENPEKFDPERFAPENKSTINSGIYQPFGNGPRNCVGMRFAQVVMKLIVARLINSYTFESYNKKPVELVHAMFLSQPKEVLVKLEPVFH